LKREKISKDTATLCYQEAFRWLQLGGVPSSEEEECSVGIDEGKGE
jgi:hypothetical protein